MSCENGNFFASESDSDAEIQRRREKIALRLCAFMSTRRIQNQRQVEINPILYLIWPQVNVITHQPYIAVQVGVYPGQIDIVAGVNGRGVGLQA